MSDRRASGPLDAQARIVGAIAEGRERARLAARSDRDQIALAWHDVTCPEAGGCQSRRQHAQASPVVNGGVLERFLERLAGGGDG